MTGRLLARIRREGPIAFDAFVEHALYDPDEGFYGRAEPGGAGRAGRDFVTSPEVGTLFGALVARALDGWWDALDRPDPYVVVEAGAGRGRLAADVLRAEPRCAPALRYVLVERSASLRHAQGALVPLEPVERALGPAVRPSAHDEPIPVTGLGPLATALDDLPAFMFDGVVIANELLDNLPFRIVERGTAGWTEVRVGLDGDGLVEVLVPAPPELTVEADRVAAGVPVSVGTRLPVPTGVAAWLEACSEVLHRGFVAVVDYGAGVEDLVERGPEGWLRTYRGHERGGAPLADVGAQDVTCDVPLEYVRAVAERDDLRLVQETSQADWLRSLGVDALVEEARAAWDASAATGDLAAVAARSRVHEADALTDPTGLGAHTVLVLAKGLPPLLGG